MWSRSTWASGAASSTPRSAAAACKRSAVPGTASPPTADNAAAEGAMAVGPRPGAEDDRTVSFSVSRWWRRRSLRARVTVITSVGLAVALVAAALLLRGALQASLTRGVDGTARQGAREVATLANTNRLPDPVPVVAGTLTVQVLGPDGRIVDASPRAGPL